MALLRWEPSGDSAWHGRLGKLYAALIVRRAETGRFTWQIEGIFNRYICTGRGEVATAPAARRACELAWGRWIAAAGLAKAPAGDDVQKSCSGKPCRPKTSAGPYR